MSETKAAVEPVPAAEPQKLDDVLLAMDVVDTLRHRERIVDRELNAEARESELIARLREIYDAQGIEVPDRILKDGVKALEEQRFTYKAPKRSVATRLARAYVSRSKWLPTFGWGAGGLAAIAVSAQVFWAGPRAAEWSELPVEIAAASDLAQGLAMDPALDLRIEAIERSGLVAVEDRDREAARSQLAAIEAIRRQLDAEYELRIVSRPGEDTGFYRIPEDNPIGRNYYLVVEPVAPGGQVVMAPVFNEETQKTERVAKWAQRVSQQVFDRVAEDKAPDQIIQNDILGYKRRGVLEPQFDEAVPGGAITKW